MYWCRRAPNVQSDWESAALTKFLFLNIGDTVHITPGNAQHALMTLLGLTVSNQSRLNLQDFARPTSCYRSS